MSSTAVLLALAAALLSLGLPLIGVSIMKMIDLLLAVGVVEVEKGKLPKRGCAPRAAIGCFGCSTGCLGVLCALLAVLTALGWAVVL